MDINDLWTLDPGTPAATQPILVGDVLISATSSELRATDIHSGQPCWPPVPWTNNSVSDIACSGNRIFFLGNPIFFPGASAAVPGNVPVQPQGQVLPGGLFGGGGAPVAAARSLIVLDVSSGRFCSEWAGVVPAERDLLAPMIADDVLIMRDSAGKLTGYDARTGIKPGKLWQIDAAAVAGRAGVTPGPAALGDGAVFFVVAGRLVAINQRSGQLRWEFPAAAVPAGGQAADYMLDQHDSLPEFEPPMVGNGLVVVVGQRAAYALDWRTGKRVWSIRAAANDRLNTPVISWSGDTIFFTSRDGDARGYLLSTGQEFWHASAPVAKNAAHIATPQGGYLAPVINPDVFVRDHESGHLHTEDRVFLPAGSGTVYIVDVQRNDSDANLDPVARFNVSLVDSVTASAALAYSPQVGNGSLFMTTRAGRIEARAFTSSTAVMLDEPARLTLPKKPGYSFGTGDFSLESWLRTTHGGDLLTQSPDAAGNGFRLAIVNQPDGIMADHYGEGRVQFTVCDSNGDVLLFAQTAPSRIADGYWHHLTLTRNGNEVRVFIDGISQPVISMVHRSLIPAGEASQLPPATERKYFAPDSLSENVAVASVATSAAPFVVGAYVPGDALFQDANATDYSGLVAEIRIWDRSVTAKAARNRMAKLLTGHEPGLVGYFPLNQKTADTLKDATDDSLLGPANVAGARCITSNIELDESLFPYLLPAPGSSWPYQERWTARAEDAPKWAPAGSSEVVCFATDRALYGLDAIHGTRKWGCDVMTPSPPAADRRHCYLLDGIHVRALDIESGRQNWFCDLGAQHPATRVRLGDFAPVVTAGAVVVSADGQHFYWLHPGSGAPLGYYETSKPTAIPPQAHGKRLYLLADGELLAFDDQLPAAAGPTAMQPAASAALNAGSQAQIAADSQRVAVADGGVIHMFDAASLSAPGALPADRKFVWNPPDLSGQKITGMALAAKVNTLVATTAAGVVHFLDYGSGKRKSMQTVPGNAQVFAPVADDGLVFCTTAPPGGKPGAGSIRVYDLKTGGLRGVDRTDAAPTGPAYLAQGTAYFGVDNQGARYPRKGGAAYPANGRLDGEALHSVVFGRTLALLRQAGDADVAVPAVDPVFAGDPAQTSAGGNTFEDGNFALEVWINSEDGKGGELLSTPPGRGVNGPAAGFSIAVDAAGVITAQHLKDGAASLFTSQATAATDGRWHHLAAVFRHNGEHNQQLCYLYLDGQALSGVAHAAPTTSPVPTVNRSALIGGSGSSHFHGMIDDIRVWATWLPAAEVVSRRNVRLLGNEPDLLVNWTFDNSGVRDASTNKLSALDPNGADRLNIRLTDLNFTTPHYPYLLASSAGVKTVTETLANGAGEKISSANYKTRIRARAADGSPRAGTKIRVWASEPTQATPDGGGRVALAPDRSADFTLDDKGELLLDLTSADLLHSPVLWIWADFMYPNERFHVAAVSESNEHLVIAPPHLLAHSSMMQDYAYAPGDSLGTNHGTPGQFTLHAYADITTIHTTISAVTADGNPLANEIIELWSDRHVSIEYKTANISLNRENSHKFRTGPDGTLSFILHEDARQQGNLLDCPAIMARAGFMPRHSRFVIAPAENANKHLASVTDQQILGIAPQAPGEKPKTLIAQFKSNHPKEADSTAPAIASVLNNMASLAKKHEPHTGNVAGFPGTTGSAAPHTGAAMMAGHLMAADAVQSIHGTALSQARMSMTPEYMPSKHMIITLEADGSWTHTNFDTVADLDNHIATKLNLAENSSEALFKSIAAHSQNEHIGGWFTSLAHDISHAWHEIEHGVEQAWDKARHFVVRTWDEIKQDVGAIVHQVEVVIADAAKAIGKWVIKTVKDVVEHVVAFLKKVWVAIKDIYNFLKALFDWNGILDAHNILRDTFNGTIDGLEKQLATKIPNEIDGWFSEVKTGLAAALGVAKNNPRLGGSVRSHNKSMPDSAAHCVSYCKSSKSNYIKNKLDSHGTETHALSASVMHGRGSMAMPFQDSAFANLSPHLNSDFAKMIDDFKAILQQPGGIAKLTIQELLVMLDDVMNIVVDLIEAVLLGAVEMVDFAVKMIQGVMNFEIKIPFVTELYALVTGSKLTMLDILSLILGFPVHVVAATLGYDPDRVAVQNMIDAHPAFPAVSAGPGNIGSTASPELRMADTIFLVSTIISGILAGVTDVVQGEANLLDPKVAGNKGNGKKVDQTACEMILGVANHFAAVIKGVSLFTVRNVQAKNPAVWSDPFIYMALIGPVIHLGVGLKGWNDLSGNKMAQGFGKLPKFSVKGRSVDNIPIPILLSFIGIGATTFSVYKIVAHTHANEPGEVIAEDVINIITGIDLIFAFLNWSVVCVETEVDGVVLSSIGLGLLDFGVNSVANPAIHVGAGYGHEIL